MGATLRQTPRKTRAQVIQETPFAPSRSKYICVLAEKNRKRWIPALVPRFYNAKRDTVEAIFPDGTHSKFPYGSLKVLRIEVGDQIRLNDDSHTYTVVQTLKNDETTQFRLENGDNALELAARRGGRTVNASLKDIFFHDVEKFNPLGMKAPSLITPRRKTTPKRTQPARAKKSVLENGSPLPVGQRARSIIYNLPATPETGDLFSDCVFVVIDDFIGEITSSLNSRGAQTVSLLSDLLHTSKMPQEMTYNGPKSAKFFAVIGNAITPTIPFLEALAIGWPCLSTNFIRDCLKQNKFGRWEDYLLGIVSPEGFLKSQDCFDFKHQWDQEFSLAQQFEHRSAMLGNIMTPIYVSDNISTDMLVLVGLACFKFYLLEANNKTPPGSIFIDAAPYGTATCTPELKLRMCRQTRLEATVAVNAQWLIQCILNQNVA